jgi:hypothetical protein
VGLDPRGFEYTSYSPDTCELGLEMRISWDEVQGRVEGYDVRLVEAAGSSAGEVFAMERVQVRLSHES